VTELVLSEPSRGRVLLEEVRKLPAFVRRDFLTAWSYRMAFFSDIVNLIGQGLLFYFVGLMVDESKLPSYGGEHVSYLQFAAVGMALSVFVQFGLQRVAAAVRAEQLMGTLESLLTSPTATPTIQVGSVAFDLVYLPLRLVLFLVSLTIAFGLAFEPGGILPAAIVLLAFLPFVWGLGVASAAMMLTFRRGGGLIGIGVVGLGLISGAYFPVTLLPGWLEATAAANPIALAIDGMRDALLGGAGWSAVAPALAVLAPLSVVSLALGVTAFRLALRRERRVGTVGQY
jgi:ABC-2 type transport system permease protein